MFSTTGKEYSFAVALGQQAIFLPRYNNVQAIVFHYTKACFSKSYKLEQRHTYSNNNPVLVYQHKGKQQYPTSTLHVKVQTSCSYYLQSTLAQVGQESLNSTLYKIERHTILTSYFVHTITHDIHTNNIPLCFADTLKSLC